MLVFQNTVIITLPPPPHVPWILAVNFFASVAFASCVCLSEESRSSPTPTFFLCPQSVKSFPTPSTKKLSPPTPATHLYTQSGNTVVEVLWMQSVCFISSYLHSCSPPIIHGNLTCDTIFIQHNGLVKIGSGNAKNKKSSFYTFIYYTEKFYQFFLEKYCVNQIGSVRSLFQYDDDRCIGSGWRWRTVKRRSDFWCSTVFHSGCLKALTVWTVSESHTEDRVTWNLFSCVVIRTHWNCNCNFPMCRSVRTSERFSVSDQGLI